MSHAQIAKPFSTNSTSHTTSASPSQLVSTLLVGSVEGEVQLLTSSSCGQLQQQPKHRKLTASDLPCAQNECQTFLNKFNKPHHISQPVAIGLDTACRLSGRRSTIAYLIILWSTAAAAATQAWEADGKRSVTVDCLCPSPICTDYQTFLKQVQQATPHQPARRNWSRHCL